MLCFTNCSQVRDILAVNTNSVQSRPDDSSLSRGTKITTLIAFAQLDPFVSQYVIKKASTTISKLQLKNMSHATLDTSKLIAHFFVTLIGLYLTKNLLLSG
ncbi:hypothetical protein EG68_08657 [Paragonimus skrjabini miyazakii]|uniref:Uncharacterized protein n=1 Tax=Paragonimus skrjabini miyazakii TaxID=59628 RepID=A0A8S9YUN1_9TREM|nr:hypothetical protein EG68_08657 [Paragonimus skrjabini miyazakii]